jgi:hypothetical protein
MQIHKAGPPLVSAIQAVVLSRIRKRRYTGTVETLAESVNTSANVMWGAIVGLSARDLASVKRLDNGDVRISLLPAGRHVALYGPAVRQRRFRSDPAVEGSRWV